MATIRKLRGKWQAIIRKKDHKHIAKTFINKITASKWAKDVEARMDRNIYEDFTKAAASTLKDLIIKYRDEVVINHKAARTTSSKLNVILKHDLVYLSLMQLKSSHIYKFKKELAETRAPYTVNIYLKLLKTIWITAKRMWDINLPESPLVLVPLNKVDNERDRILTKEEYQRLLNAAAESKMIQLRDVIRFAYTTAARIGEIERLKRDDVDFNKKTATFLNTKNGTDREIPLAEDCIEILKRYPFGSTYFKIPYNSFRFYFKQARHKAGLDDFRAHDLRACAITNMLLSGMDQSSVAVISGHKSWSQLKRYSRIKPTDLLEKVNNVAKLNIS